MAVAHRLPESPLHAAIHGWDYPLSREGMLMLDLIDMTGYANSSKKLKYKPQPRPWKTKGERLGFTELPRDEAIAVLRANAGR